FFSSRRRHTRWPRDWSSDVCSSDLLELDHGLWQLTGLQVTAGSNTIPTATVTLKDHNGETIQQGADMVMVKPAGPYLDIISAVRSEERRVGKEGRYRS